MSDDAPQSIAAAASEPPLAAADASPDLQDLLSHTTAMRVIARRMTKTPDEAKDLVQDALEIAVRGIQEGRIQSKHSLAGYLHQVMKHAATRQAVVHQRVQLHSELPWLVDELTPFDCFADQELKQLAQEALHALPTARERELVCAFYVRGDAKAQLMQRFELSDNGFDQLLSRARRRLRDLIRTRIGIGAPSANDSGARDSITNDSRGKI